MSTLSQFLSASGILKNEEFLSSGTWVNPGVEVVFLNMVGGGGSGRAVNQTAYQGQPVPGGGGGFAFANYFHAVSGNQTVTIGAGGASHTGSMNNNTRRDGSDGGNTSFGSLTAQGGYRGTTKANERTAFASRQWAFGVGQGDYVYYFGGGDVNLLQNQTDRFQRYRNGLSGTGGTAALPQTGPPNGNIGTNGIIAGGGGAGLFGNGGRGVMFGNANVVGFNVDVGNSGAGSGAAVANGGVTRTITVQAGAAGRVQVFWME
jgi:hypothetical protein